MSEDSTFMVNVLNSLTLFIFDSSTKILVIRVEIHNILVRIAKSEDPDKTASALGMFCLFVCLILFFTSHQGSSWVEPVLSKDYCVLLKDKNAVMPVRLEPATSRSRVKHSTTEPLHSLWVCTVSI